MRKINDQEWLRKNFKRLIGKYGGRYVLIADRKVFPVDRTNIASKEKEIRRKYKISPIGMPIPRKKDLVSLLSCPA